MSSIWARMVWGVMKLWALPVVQAYREQQHKVWIVMLYRDDTLVTHNTEIPINNLLSGTCPLLFFFNIMFICCVFYILYLFLLFYTKEQLCL